MKPKTSTCFVLFEVTNEEYGKGFEHGKFETIALAEFEADVLRLEKYDIIEVQKTIVQQVRRKLVD